MMEPLEMDLKASHTDSPQRIRSPNDKQSSVGGDSTEFYNNQQQHKSSSRVGSPVTASPKRTLSGHTDDIFGNNLMRPANANQQQPQFGEFFDDSANTNATPGRGGITASGLSSNPLATYDDIISDRSRMGSSPLNSAVASAARTNSRDVLPVDQSPKSVKWLYRDPSGAVQGTVKCIFICSDIIIFNNSSLKIMN